MVAVIVILDGWDPHSDCLKAVARAVLVGDPINESFRVGATQVGAGAFRMAVKKTPGTALKVWNKAIPFLKMTKAGEKGVVNFTKMVPVAGGFVGAGANALSTQLIGKLAKRILKDGPNSTGGDATLADASPVAPEAPTDMT